MKRLFTIFYLSVIGFPLFSQTTSVQIIHNSPDPVVASVDVYFYDGTFWIPQPVLYNFGFQEASPYVPVPASSGLRIALAPYDGTPSLSDTLVSFPLPPLTANQEYVVVVCGLLGNSSAPLEIKVAPSASTASNSGSFAMRVFHGSPDAPAVSVWASPNGVTPLFADLEYGSFSLLAEYPADYYYLAISPASDPNQLMMGFDADASTLGGLGCIIMASGFVAPGAPEEFKLLLVLPDGTVIELPENPGFRLQIAHNSPAPALASADIHLEVAPGVSFPIVQGLGFRTATPTLLLPLISGNILVTPAGGNPSNPLLSLPFNPQSFKNYLAIAHGVPNPGTNNFSHAFSVNGSQVALGIQVVDDAKIVASASNKLNVYAFHHGADVPAVDLYRNDNGNLSPLIPDFSYSDTHQTELDAVGTLRIDVMPAGTPNAIKAYTAPISLFGGQSVTLLVSGFLTPDDENVSNCPAFGLFALQVGGGNFIPLPELNLVGLDHPTAQASLTLYPIPARETVTVERELETFTPFFLVNCFGQTVIQGVLTGKTHTLDVSSLAPGLYVLCTADAAGSPVRQRFLKK
ncbi:MAG: DUF4397 domain-containing protein [Flavobacteriales bacterium]|nr:DUF4397 domain-containing protein [Flavobacteriales bacterium]MDW8410696.1 DUF4397 domain-containing protein [Flavobacteriales bacterium]